jgi:hypothetical protein
MMMFKKQEGEKCLRYMCEMKTRNDPTFLAPLVNLTIQVAHEYNRELISVMLMVQKNLVYRIGIIPSDASARRGTKV